MAAGIEQEARELLSAAGVADELGVDYEALR